VPFLYSILSTFTGNPDFLRDTLYVFPSITNSDFSLLNFTSLVGTTVSGNAGVFSSALDSFGFTIFGFAVGVTIIGVASFGFVFSSALTGLVISFIEFSSL
jgi:hypothetical protein